MLTAFGVIAVASMMVMYAFERSNSRFILALAYGCLLSSRYASLAAPPRRQGSLPSTPVGDTARTMREKSMTTALVELRQ
jgi:hypothetical protein